MLSVAFFVFVFLRDVHSTKLQEHGFTRPLLALYIEDIQYSFIIALDDNFHLVDLLHH